jgi:hypothetical protein
VDSPKVMTDGNWRLGLFVDDRATDEQAELLTAVMGGQKGGPMEALAPLVGEMLGVERASIEIVEDGLRHSVRIGDALDFEIQDIVPFGIQTGERSASWAFFTRSPPSSGRPKRNGRTSTHSASSYEAKTGLSTSEFSWAA